MNVICPNCQQETQGTACQWCQYPLPRSQPTRAKVAKGANGRPGTGDLAWIILALLTAIFSTLAVLFMT